MKLYSALILVILLAMLPAQATASDTVEKTFCAQAIGYKSVDELKADLLTHAKRLAVNELFGELLAASTDVENFVVTSDQIRTSSVGFIRLEGAIDYHNGSNFVEGCVTIHAYATEQDREKFQPVKLTKRHCAADAKLTTRELADFTKEEVIVQALLDYDRRLEQRARSELLRLMQRVNYLESGFISETETYCVRAEGYVVPIEIISLLEAETSASLPTSATTNPLSWTVRANMPTARAAIGATATKDGKIYVIGGGNVSSSFATVEAYDPKTNTWAMRTPMPTARAGLGVAIANNSKIYAIGGASQGGSRILAVVEEYNPTTDTWTTRAGMPTARAGGEVATYNDGRIYVIGGWDGQRVLATVESYDPTTNTWMTNASMPTARLSPGIAVSNGKIYVIGGWDGHQPLATIEEYNPATNTWAKRADMPTARSNLGVATGSNGKIYTVGGTTGLSSLATVERYDPTTDTWSIDTNMSTARRDLALIATNDGKLYVIGGGNEKTPVIATVEEAKF